MLIEEKPSLDDELLAHFGVRGMKWGVRRGKKTTGLRRRQGALIDRNERLKFQSRKALRGDKHTMLSFRIAKKLMGEETFKRRMNAQIKDLNAQNARIRAGKRTFEDKLDGLMNIPPNQLFISRTPK